MKMMVDRQVTDGAWMVNFLLCISFHSFSHYTLCFLLQKGRIAENPDMDISPGDSTPTSEASYPLAGAPSVHGLVNVQHNDLSTIPTSTVGLPNALPRLASHPNASSVMSSSSSASASAAAANAAAASMHFSASSASAHGSGVVVGGATMLPTTGLASVSSGAGVPVMVAGVLQTQNNSNHRKMDPVAMLQQQAHLASSTSPNVS